MNSKQSIIAKIIEDVQKQLLSPQEGHQLLQEIRSGEVIPSRYSIVNQTVSASIPNESPHAVILTKPGDIEDVAMRPIWVPEPGDQEVQIAVRSFSLNFGDLLSVRGLYPTMPDYPFTPGFEASGVVVKVGKSIQRIKIGDEVIALLGQSMGAHSTLVNTDERTVVKKPENISFEEACSFPTVLVTNLLIFEKAQLKKGDSILIQTAAGGTGLIAVQMALQAGATVFATAGSASKIDYLRKMGVQYPIHYREEDFVERVMFLTQKRGVDVVLNTLSGDAIQKGLNILAPGGRYIEIAMTALKSASSLNLSKMVSNQSFFSIDARKYLLEDLDRAQAALENMVNIIKQGKIKTTVGKTFDLDQIQQAYRYLENRENIGKVVVRLPYDIVVEEQDRESEELLQPARYAASESNKRSTSQDIAIIGMSGRFPGADDLSSFWKNLRDGVNSITKIPESRWDLDAYYDPNPKRLDRTHCGWGGFLSNIDKFDAHFFNMSGKEAESTDPQQRLLLEETWKALEDAGYVSEELSGSKCGVFIGVGKSDYLQDMLDNGVQPEPQSFWGNANSVLASRISYFLNLKGPSVAIDTACSSSLVAIYTACQSLWLGDSDIAIAGGVFINVTPQFYILSSNAQMLSVDGQCKAFADEANGFVPSEGVGVVVLKPLDTALQDRDHIYGVIKAIGVNQDGKTNGITAPSTLSQTELERSVYTKGNIHPETISYVEAHGTGTKLGDPIEIEALTNAFGAQSRKQHCAIGSVKSNIGHTGTAAGIASLIKVLLSFRYKQLPPTLHVSNANRLIDFANSPFHLQSSLTDWTPVTFDKRRAAVSSFGFSGTNAHLVVEEPPTEGYQTSNNSRTHSYELILLSAKTGKALKRRIKDLMEWLLINKDHYSLENIGYTLCIGRNHFPVRMAFTARSKEELLEKLNQTLSQYDENGQAMHVGTEKDSPQFGNEIIHKLGMLQRDSIECRDHLQLLADLYIEGCLIDYSSVFQNRLLRRIPLPAYSFEKDRYWFAKQHVSEDLRVPNIRVLEKNWVMSVQQHQVAVPMFGTIVILANSNTTEAASRLFAGEEGVHPIILCHRLGSNVEESNDPSQGYMNFAIAEQGARAAVSLLNRDISVRGIIDLSDIYESPVDKIDWIPLGKIAFLQGMLNNLHQEPLRIIHITRGLQTFQSVNTTLAGAETAGLYKMLGVEYRKIISKTIDMDAAVNDIEQIGRIVRSEWRNTEKDKQSEICYRAGQRYSPVMRSVELHSPRQRNIDPEKVVVITGGTRGIGIEVAHHMVEKGVKKLVLMGLQELPPKERWKDILDGDGYDPAIVSKVKRLADLEKKGATVEMYFGDLTDWGKLSDYFLSIRQTWGPIGGVIHCAGLTSMINPAFIKKSSLDIGKVYNPKVTGLQVLHRIFEPDSLDFFILFSSVSGQMPLLGSGMSDYAAANSFMDMFAAYQHSCGNTYYQSVNWANWGEVGMGEAKSPVYKLLGLQAHKTRAGLDMLDTVMSMPGRCNLTPMHINKEIFDASALLNINQPDTMEQRVESLQQYTANERLLNETAIIHTDVMDLLKNLFATELKLDQSRLQEHVNFDEFGVDSILLAELVKKMEEQFHVTLDPTVVLEHSTLQRLSNYLVGLPIKPLVKDEESGCRQSILQLPKAEVPYNRLSEAGKGSRSIAVIGMSCNFPGANNKEIFWSNLITGKSSIAEVPKSRWDISRYYAPSYEKGKSISKWGGFIDSIEFFDESYFHFTKEEASHLDPLSRQFLEVSTQTIRDAGYNQEELWNRKVGVFVGARAGHYSKQITDFHRSSISSGGQNFIAAHVSHFFNFKGPNMVIDTACSSSLVSIHLACQSLIMNESEIAIAGGVDILWDEQLYLMLTEGKALSPDGVCHTFDVSANGFVPGEGCGTVLLKPLDQALADGDRIYAVIDASAVNNDGHTMGVTTPNPDAQSDVIREALSKGGIDPATISYIEAHGTGTMIGDPIELKALTKVFRESTEEKQFCAVGSVKTNIGHLLNAAGVASFMKVVLSLYHKQLPPTLHCETPNPRFGFEQSPFYPNTQLQDWKVRGSVRRAGVSSFGFGGTNAHLILSEAESFLTPGYMEKRKPLQPIEFNRKYFWVAQNPIEKNVQKDDPTMPLLVFHEL